MKKLFSSVNDGRGFDIVLVALPLGFLFVMAGLPLIYNIVMSFQEVDMFSLGTFVRPFVGFKNYIDLFRQPETLPILFNTVTFVVTSIAVQFAIGFGLARRVCLLAGPSLCPSSTVLGCPSVLLCAFFFISCCSVLQCCVVFLFSIYQNLLGVFHT